VTGPSHSDEAEGEVVDGLPVVAAPQQIEVAQPGTVPVRQAAAIAASTFFAGAATVAVVSRRRRRVTRRKRRRGGASLGEIVTSNSFLVDVHLLRRD
jgi:hypothetical protein